MEVTLKINGERYPCQIQPNWTLLYVLRDVLDMTGTKRGCGTGDCGACKVLLDGKAVNACTVLAKNVGDREIGTIEGLGNAGTLHPVQQAFVDTGAIQCGFCTPGMVITAVAFLEENPDPTVDEIKEALENNLCRCTGYVKIVEAIRQASRILRGGRDVP